MAKCAKPHGGGEQLDEGTIAAILIFPRPWPPARPWELISRVVHDTRVSLRADIAGRIGLHVGKDRTHTFQPIRVNGSGRAVLIATWSPHSASLHINRAELQLAEVANGEFYVLSDNDAPPEPYPMSYGRIDTNVASTDSEYLFLATLADVRDRLQEGAAYSLIRAAGLLRQLFLDDAPLVDEVNRKYRTCMTFTTMDYRSGPPRAGAEHLEAFWQNLDPSYFPRAPTVKVDRREFLRAPVLHAGPIHATVRDLIRACANAKGGVHLGKARTLEEKLLLDWDHAMRVGGEQPSLAAIAGVCRVCLESLRPLVEAIHSGSANAELTDGNRRSGLAT